MLLAERYRVERLLGEGGMGQVYVGRHVVIDKPVAIKVLRSEHAASEELRERFLMEAQAAARLRHPHVINVTDFGATPSGTPFFVMELLEGHELASELRAHPRGMPWATAARVILEVAEAVHAAHAAGVIHRDLKPENVFLARMRSGAPIAKVLDFGIAKVASRHITKTGIIYGTPEYMAPEQARGEQLDPRADVYALGCMLWEMTTGNAPLRGATIFDTLAMRLHQEMPPYPGGNATPPGLAAVMADALARDRAHRIPSMPAFAARISALDASAAVAASRAPAPAPSAVENDDDLRPPPTIFGRLWSLVRKPS
jgi:serine/threonine-protein kinase